MHWNYQPSPVVDHHYMFDGTTIITKGIQTEIENTKIFELIHMVRTAAMELEGLDYIQKLTEITSGKVVWVIDGISIEEKQRLKTEQKMSDSEIKEYNVHTILFPEEY